MVTIHPQPAAAPNDPVGVVARRMVDAWGSVVGLHGAALIEAGCLAFIDVARAAHAEYGPEAGRDIVGEALGQVRAAYRVAVA